MEIAPFLLVRLMAELINDLMDFSRGLASLTVSVGSDRSRSRVIFLVLQVSKNSL